MRLSATRLAYWIWLMPLVFLVHDAEEIATMVPWLRGHEGELPAPVRPYAAAVTPASFTIAVGVLLVVILLVTCDGTHRARLGARSWLFLITAGGLAGNAVTHAVEAVYFGGYTPGVVTAVLLVVPYAVGLGWALERARWISRRGLMALVALGAVLQAPFALAALTAGWYVDRLTR